MKEFCEKNKWITLLFIIGAVYFFLTYVAPLLTPILLAFLTVALFGPLLMKLQKKLKVPRQMGILILLILTATVVGVAAWLIIVWAINHGSDWAGYLEEWEKQLELTVDFVCDWLSRTFRMDVTYLREGAARIGMGLLGKVGTDALPGIMGSLMQSMKNVVSGGAFLITFLIGTILLAKDYDEYMNYFLEHKECYVWLEALCGTLRYIVSFVKAQLIIMGTVAGTITVVLLVIRVPNGLLWGLLAGTLDILPFVGTGIVLLPLILIQLAKGAYGKSVICVLLYVGCVLIREFLEPKILGKKMGVFPIAVLTSIYVGIQLFGFWGVVKGPLGFVLVYQIYQSLTRSS